MVAEQIDTAPSVLARQPALLGLRRAPVPSVRRRATGRWSTLRRRFGQVRCRHRTTGRSELQGPRFAPPTASPAGAGLKPSTRGSGSARMPGRLGLPSNVQTEGSTDDHQRSKDPYRDTRRRLGLPRMWSFLQGADQRRSLPQAHARQLRPHDARLDPRTARDHGALHRDAPAHEPGEPVRSSSRNDLGVLPDPSLAAPPPRKRRTCRAHGRLIISGQPWPSWQSPVPTAPRRPSRSMSLPSSSRVSTATTSTGAGRIATR